MANLYNYTACWECLEKYPEQVIGKGGFSGINILLLSSLVKRVRGIGNVQSMSGRSMYQPVDLLTGRKILNSFL